MANRSANGITALSTAVVAAFTITLWRVGRDQHEAAMGALSLARDEFIASHRPEIILREAYVEDHVDGSRICYYITNRGKNPGRIMESRVVAEHHADTGLVLNVLPTTYNDIGDIVFAAGETRYFEFGLDFGLNMSVVGIDMDMMVGGLYFLGTIVYADDSGRRRRTVFRRKYVAERRRFCRIEDAEHEYAD